MPRPAGQRNRKHFHLDRRPGGRFPTWRGPIDGATRGRSRPVSSSVSPTGGCACDRAKRPTADRQTRRRPPVTLVQTRIHSAFQIGYTLFYEDPILPDNFDAMGLVAQNISIPIATGERLHTIHEFQMLLSRGAVQYVRPDVCLAGGLTHSKKIAAIAEAHYVGVVPHNPLSPVSTAACLQLAACIPNFTIQEYPVGEHEPPKSEIVKTPLELENGFLIVPDAPGIGIELADDAHERYPPTPREVRTRLNVDGSVVDQ
jgi:galactonate dehydratase